MHFPLTNQTSLCRWNGLDWTLSNLYGKLSILYPNSRAYLLACISKAFVLYGLLLSVAVSLEHLCPNFIIFSSFYWGRVALIAVMNKLHAVMLFNCLEMSWTANPPCTSPASPQKTNSWKSQLKGFFFVTAGVIAEAFQKPILQSIFPAYSYCTCPLMRHEWIVSKAFKFILNGSLGTLGLKAEWNYRALKS